MGRDSANLARASVARTYGIVRVYIVFLLLLAALVSLACVIGEQGKSLEARYTRDAGLSCMFDRSIVTQPKFECSNPTKDYLQLRSDGSFVTQEEGLTFAGTYRIDGNEITLILPTGVASVGVMSSQRNVITDNENQRWVKEGTLYNRELQIELSQRMAFIPEDSSEDWVIEPYGAGLRVFINCPALGQESLYFPTTQGVAQKEEGIAAATFRINSATKTVPFPGQPDRKPRFIAHVRTLPDSESAVMAYSCLMTQIKHIWRNNKILVDESVGVGDRSSILGVKLGENIPVLYKLLFVAGNTVAYIHGGAGGPREDIVGWAKRLDAKIKQVQASQ